MLEEPTSLRIDDPGVRALFIEAARWQSWLDVEAALAQAQAELGLIPEAAAREIVGRRSRTSRRPGSSYRSDAPTTSSCASWRRS
jgi:hypothetical protein